MFPELTDRENFIIEQARLAGFAECWPCVPSPEAQARNTLAGAKKWIDEVWDSLVMSPNERRHLQRFNRPVAPWKLCRWQEDHQAEPAERPHKRLVETVSMPARNKTTRGGWDILVRMTPGDSTTLRTLPLCELLVDRHLETAKAWTIHYAEVTSPFCFPTDMLRRDDCHIDDPDYDTDQRPTKSVRIYQVTKGRERPIWTMGRWQSFSAAVVLTKKFVGGVSASR